MEESGRKKLEARVLNILHGAYRDFAEGAFSKYSAENIRSIYKQHKDSMNTQTGDNMNTQIRLDNWSVLALGDVYTAPELSKAVLHGWVYGHPRFPPGHCVLTTEIVGVEDGLIITKSGSRYQLDEPNADYECKFPNAKERLLAKYCPPAEPVTEQSA